MSTVSQLTTWKSGWVRVDSRRHLKDRDCPTHEYVFSRWSWSVMSGGGLSSRTSDWKVPRQIGQDCKITMINQ
jgi:hypothetical protein